MISLLRQGLVWSLVAISGCGGGGSPPENSSAAGVVVTDPAIASTPVNEPPGAKAATSSDPKIVPIEYPNAYLDETLKMGTVTVYYFKTRDTLQTIEGYYAKMGLQGGRYGGNNAAYYLTHADGSKSSATITGGTDDRASEIILRWDPAAR
jgi:hypothetical protein